MADEKKKQPEQEAGRKRFFEQFLLSLEGSEREDEGPPEEERPEEAVSGLPAAEEPAAEDALPDTVEDAEAPLEESALPTMDGSAPEQARPDSPHEEESAPAAEEIPPLDDTHTFTDEELAKLLDVDPAVFAPPENGTGESAAPEDEALKREEETLAQVYKDAPASPDGGTRVFKTEPLPEEKGPEEPPAEEEAEPEDVEPEPEEEEESDGYEPRDFRPFRRRRNYRSGCMGGIMYFAMIACISIILAAVCWQAANDVLSLNKKEVSAEITIAEDFTIDQVARQLKDAGIINYPRLFKFYSGFSHAEEKIQPGTYTVNSKLDYRAIVTNLQEAAPTLTTVEVTIPEGKTVQQTFELLAEKNVCSLEELMDCAADYEFEYDFLEGLETGSATRLEGYLFPDTYEFYENSSPERAISKFLDNFKAKITDEMILSAKEMGRDFSEILTIASLIEKEAASDAERSTIASVIYNRLASSEFPYLQIDATVQYALGEWKERLTYEDLEVDSPYNTYRSEGLPPGPICNPGLTSIRAALGPESTNYYYYALNTEGMHTFFVNKYEFDQFINSSAFGG